VAAAPRPATTAWRLVLGAGDVLAPLTGAENMAIDAALTDGVRRGAPPVLRFYLWRPACLSFGRNQPARDVYDPAAAAAAGVDIVRRPTGGLAVLHDAEVTYAVIAPVTAIGRPRAAYVRINTVLADALRRLGVHGAGVAGEAAARMDSNAAGSTTEDAAARMDADAAPRMADDPAARGDRAVAAPPPCFHRPAPGEIVVDGAKLVGSAQRVEHGVILQHGSILLDGSQLRIRAFERRTGPAANGAEPDGGTSLGALLGRVPAPDEVVAAAAAAFAALGGTALAPGTLDSWERRRVRERAAEFRSAAWTWRR
jgi:lipoyl(octanoyl) transferase